MLKNYQLEFTGKKLLSGDIYQFTFKMPPNESLDFQAGQYLVLKVPKDQSFVSRLYSLASSPRDVNKIELLVEIIPGGLGSIYLDSLEIGQKVDFMGPAGQFIIKNPARKKTFLVTGTGIAPVRSMIFSGIENYILYWGIRTYKDLYLFDEFKNTNIRICLSRENDLNAILSEEDRNYFRLGRVDACLTKETESIGDFDKTNTDYYICGGRTVVESLRLFLLSKDIPKEHIFFEKF